MFMQTFSLTNKDFFFRLQSGFTLIELLAVISILMVLSVLSIASFSSYATSQKLSTAALDIKNTLQYAKAEAGNQLTTCSSGQQFLGYKVLACCQGNGCPTCLSTKDYEVDIVCSGGTSLDNGKDLPQGISFDTSHSTSFSFLFNPLSGSVTGAGTLVVQQGNSTKNILISATGVIQ